MIHYSVWFSFQDSVPPADGLQRVHAFLDGMHRRGLVQAFRLLRNRDRNADPARAFQAAITFADVEAFAYGFAAVEHEGIRSGLHGLMVAVIKDFTAEAFEDLDVVPPTR
jgi:hypothetical protein